MNAEEIDNSDFKEPDLWGYSIHDEREGFRFSEQRCLYSAGWNCVRVGFKMQYCLAVLLCIQSSYHPTGIY